MDKKKENEIRNLKRSRHCRRRRRRCLSGVLCILTMSLTDEEGTVGVAWQQQHQFRLLAIRVKPPADKNRPA